MSLRRVDPSVRVNSALAFSDDGITREMRPSNPRSIRKDRSGFRSILQTQIQYLYGTYLLYLEIGNISRRHVFLATQDGAIGLVETDEKDVLI